MKTQSSKDQIRAAMAALEVKKPLKLHDKQPQFKAPMSLSESDAWVGLETQVATATSVGTGTTVGVGTSVGGETKVLSETLVGTETGVAPETGAGSHTWVATKTVVDVKPPVAETTPVDSETTVAERTKVDRETMVAGGTQVPRATKVSTPESTHSLGIGTATAQDSSVTLEAQSASKLHNGYTRLPNSALMRVASGELLRSEIQILLLIARFTISFQRRHAPLSKAVLERQSGLRGPAVLQAISGLLEKGLIEKIAGDQHRPNQLGLVFSEEWDFFPSGNGGEKNLAAKSLLVPAEAQVPGSHLVPGAIQVGSETTVAGPTRVPGTTQVPRTTGVSEATTALVAGATSPLVAAATYFKDTKTIENNSSLSRLPSLLQNYFLGLKPPKKRESEWQALEELLESYPAQDIADCFALVRERGIGKGESATTCHSPMSYLAKAMDGVLPEVQSHRERVREHEERHRLALEADKARVEHEEREAAEWAEKERAFEAAFPDEERQRQVIDEMLRGLPFRPGSHAGRVLAVGRWWDRVHQ